VQSFINFLLEIFNEFKIAFEVFEFFEFSFMSVMFFVALFKVKESFKIFLFFIIISFRVLLKVSSQKEVFIVVVQGH